MVLQSNLKSHLQGGGLALGPFRFSKLGMPLTLFGRNGPLWEVRGIEISIREPDFEPLSWFDPPFLVGLKASKLECAKYIMKHPVNRPKSACCLRHGFTNMCLSPREMCTSQKMRFFSKFRASSFLHRVFYHLRHGRQKK